MAIDRTVKEMKRWRESRELTMDQAGALIGDGVRRWQWYAWESGQKVPGRDNMQYLFEVSGGQIRAAHFYGQSDDALKLTG